MPYDTLPTEILEFIFSFNSFSDHKTITLVCRRWAAAVEPLLLARTCLKVSYREVPMLYASIFYGNDYNEYHALSSSIKLIDKNVLVETDRSYTCLRIEWGDERREPNLEGLQEVLDECQERFSVQKLYLKAPPGKALTDFFLKHRKWLEDLTELHFEQCSTSNAQQALSSAVQLSFPKLKQLTWRECVGYDIYGSHYRFSAPMLDTRCQRAIDAMPKFHEDINKMNATLDVPELNRLKVRVKSRKDIQIDWTGQNNQQVVERPEHVNTTDSLVLPSLNLTSCSKLQHIEILDLYDLGIIMSQSAIHIGEEIFPNLKSLSFVKCTGQTVENICEKCLNLEELTIDDTSGSFLSNLSSIPLKKLTLKNCSLWFNNAEAVLPELRYLRLKKMSSSLSLNGVTLSAPQLTTIVSARIDYNLLTITHKEQIRTMVVELNPFEGTDTIPPPNVTELFLCLRLDYGREREIVQDYLQYYPNLRRLTIFGNEGPTMCGGVQICLRNFPNLEHLCADDVTLRLADFQELARLKSLVLSSCIIIAESTDGEVMLPTLDFIRIKHVLISCYTPELNYSDRTWDRFPIYGGDLQQQQQPSVIRTSNAGFGSVNFQPKRWHEIIPTE